MADVNAPSGQAPAMAPPVHTDDQILPCIRWVLIGKSNYYMDLEKSKSNSIYKIAVDLLKHTNFFRTFAASSTIPSIYIQQFWDTVQYDKKAGSYRCQLDEQWIWEEFTQSIHTFIKDKWNQSRLQLHQHNLHPHQHQPNLRKRSAIMPQKHLTSLPKLRNPNMAFSSKKLSLKSVAASVAEDVPAVEPQVATEDADFQKALEESMKTMYAAAPRGPLPPVVIREPESGKYQPLPDVPRKGKAKVNEEQVAHDLLSLQKPKKKSPADQYIFQRRVSKPTGSFGHDESPYVVLGQSDSKEESEKAGSDAGAQDEGQAGSNPDENSEGQAGPDPGNAGDDVQSILSPLVHAGLDREHMDLDVVDVSLQPSTEQLDEGFTATAYLKVQENLKLIVEEQVLLEEPASSSGTLSSLQHMSKDISFGDLFFSDKPSDADKNAKTEVESMAMMMKHIDELEHIMANMIQVNNDMEERLDKHRARLYTLEQLDIPQQVSKAVSEVVTDAVDWAMQALLCNRFRDLLKANMKEILHQRMWETEFYKSHKDHMQLFEALEKSMNRDHSEEHAQDLARACKKKKKSRPSRASGDPGAFGSSQVPSPPPPPLSTNQESQSKSSAAPSSSKTAASAEYQVWTTTGIRLRPSISLTPADLEMDEDMGPDEQAQSSNDKDIGSAHIPKVNLRQDWWKPFEEERPATPKPAWSIRSSDVPVPTNNWASALASNYSPPPKDALLAQTDDIATFMDYKGSRPALSISKMKAAYYPGAGLEKMVLDQFWIEEECKYDIDAMTHMQILSAVRIEVFSMYGYDYMKKIVLRRADLNEHFITERDFKYLYPSDFKDLYLLNLQGHLNHLLSKDKKILTMTVNQWTRHLVNRQRVKDFQLGIESYQTQLNLTKPQWDATGFEYKPDYTIIDSPRAVMYQDKYGVQMMMRFTEIHKFKYKVFDQEGCGSKPGVHVLHSEAIEDKEDLSQPGELCWWTRQRGRL
nr:hypothetical protein [Tanacetum cinerariifolium]